MNQILITRLRKKKNILFFKIEFLFSILIITLCLLSLLYFSYQKNVRQNLSSALLSNYHISKLYSPTDIYLTELNHIENSKEPYVIGVIQIDKLNISYPILSTTTDELLKISVCRFYGPSLNSVGNVCIAGHNYNDGSFFSNLDKLKYGDIIGVIDDTNSKLDYIVYEKYETNSNDISCTSQETNNLKVVTLVTCNNFNGNRLIIKAKHLN